MPAPEIRLHIRRLTVERDGRGSAPGVETLSSAVADAMGRRLAGTAAPPHRSLEQALADAVLGHPLVAAHTDPLRWRGQS